jgi:hypothetical protein
VVRFAKALNRSVIGSMNDLTYHATVWLTEGGLSPYDVGFRPNEIPFSSLADAATATYATPRSAFRGLTGASLG